MKKWTVETLSGEFRDVEALYPRVDEQGALWFYEGSPAMQPDRIVACFSANLWAAFVPTPSERPDGGDGA